MATLLIALSSPTPIRALIPSLLRMRRTSLYWLSGSAEDSTPPTLIPDMPNTSVNASSECRCLAASLDCTCLQPARTTISLSKHRSLV